MQAEGPVLETLLRRLAECPAEFLAEPRVGKNGVVDVAAVVSDLLRDLGGALLTPEQAAVFCLPAGSARKHRNRLRAVLVAAWLLHDPWFRSRQQFAGQAAAFLNDGVAEVAGLIQAPHLVADPDRREELARLCLKGLGLRPAGESVAQAEDRLTTLSSVERQRVIREAQAAEKRARDIREAMARKAAEEAAAKYMRE
jgi:hypothetical protein